MRRYKVIEVNKDGKIEFTKEELEVMLNEAYNDGYSDGYKDYTPITWGDRTATPSPIPTYKNYFTCDKSTGKTCTITNSSSCNDVDGQTTINGYFG